MTRKKILVPVFSLLLALCLAACVKGQRKTATGKLVNATGFDGCAWMIELDQKDSHGNTSLEITNSIGKYKASDGDRVKIHYVETPAASACMAGTLVHITSMRRIR